MRTGRKEYHEKHLHNYFDKQKIKGEWFKLLNSEIEYIRKYFNTNNE